MVRVTAFMALYLLASAYALGRGGRPERLAALIMTGGLVLTWLLITPIIKRFEGPEVGVEVADGLMLIGFVWLAMTADRYWPLWIAAMQAVIVLSHVAVAAKPVHLPTYYKNTIQLWAYPQLILLVGGTLRERLRTAPASWERSIGTAWQIAVLRMQGILRRGPKVPAARRPAAPD